MTETPEYWERMTVEERLRYFVEHQRSEEDDEETDWQAGYQECLEDIQALVLDGVPIPKE